MDSYSWRCDNCLHILLYIYYCDLLSNGNYSKLEFEKLYIGTLSEQIKIYKHFEKNYERRESLKHEVECKDMTPRDPSVIHCTRIVMD